MAASSFGHFGLDERRSLFRLRAARVPVAEIASRLGRHRSTIYRHVYGAEGRAEAAPAHSTLRTTSPLLPKHL